MPECVMEGECEPVQLEPFVHQVGGSSSMLRFDEATVCKPLISREHQFYETMPTDMAEFTPQYRGIVKVTFHEDQDGYINLVAWPPEHQTCKRMLPASSSPSSSGEGAQSDNDSDSESTVTATRTTRQRFRLRRSGSIEVEGVKDKYMEDAMPSTYEKEVLTNQPPGHNPWSLRMHKEQLSKMVMRKNSQGKNSHKFILLENLASHMQLPCILDLKMGTRTYGDDATQQKRESHMRKCGLTTSAAIGLRLCGMQVYQANTGNYICHNKYYGRKVDVTGFRDSLHQFLHNGYRFRVELIDRIIDRLRQLYSMLSKQTTFRFYSSSLLIMFDGADSDKNGPLPSSSSSSSSQGKGVTSGGLKETPPKEKNGPSTDNSVVGAKGGGSSSSSASSSASAVDKSVDNACAGRSSTDKKHSSGNNHRRDGGTSSRDRDNIPRVDVRMIDFAHATHQGFMYDNMVHHGPDKGYLFGLENLISMFLDMKTGE